MLVRFLSFAASVIGTRRYRPIFISLTAIILSAASIVAVTSVLSGQARQAASTDQQKRTESKQQATPSLGLDKQATHDEPTSTQPAQSQAPSGTPDGGTKPAGSSTGNPSNPITPEIQLSTVAPTLSITTPTTLVHASMSDKTSVSWLVTPDTPDTGVGASIEQGATGPNSSLRFRLEQNAAPGTYQFTISVKDTARNLDISKKITVTVN